MTIAIIGGGISGLAVLHYLKQRFANTIDIVLFERESSPGGTVRTLKKDQCLFESGPNGYDVQDLRNRRMRVEYFSIFGD